MAAGYNKGPWEVVGVKAELAEAWISQVPLALALILRATLTWPQEVCNRLSAHMEMGQKTHPIGWDLSRQGLAPLGEDREPRQASRRPLVVQYKGTKDCLVPILLLPPPLLLFFFLPLLLLFKRFLFLRTLYAQHWGLNLQPEIKSPMLHPLSKPGPPSTSYSSA